MAQDIYRDGFLCAGVRIIRLSESVGEVEWLGILREWSKAEVVAARSQDMRCKIELENMEDIREPSPQSVAPVHSLFRLILLILTLHEFVKCQLKFSVLLFVYLPI